MQIADDFTGERFIPGVAGEIAYEHRHRYAFARRFSQGRRVVDAACGEGYGAALIADVATSVIGVDIDAGVVKDAAIRYADHRNLRFETASVTALPIPDASVDVIVSFETIEHLRAADQPRMLVEFARVLAPGGLLILSSPNRPEYSDARNYANPFHLHELDRGELAQLLWKNFSAQQWYRQRRYLGSAIWAEQSGNRFEALSGSAATVQPAVPANAMYFIVVAASVPEALPAQPPVLSLYADADDAEWQRIDHEAREVLRLDALLFARDRDLDRQAAAVQEIRAMVAHRDLAIADRDAEIAAARARIEDDAAERARLEREIAAQERIVAYRESPRWWFALPWLGMRRLWRRIARQ